MEAPAMTPGRMIELAVAVVLLGVGIWLYRRKAPASGTEDYGSQGAVLLFVIAVIMGIHALGLMEYRPSRGELDILKERSQ